METDSFISPTKHLMQFKITLEDYSVFRAIWSNQKVLDFYCLGKQVVSNEIILDVRAMRVNEFAQILNDHNIKWTLV